jgi:hypothetical protein
MQTIQVNKMRSLKAAQAFLDANAELLGPSVKGSPRTDLDTIVAELNAIVATQADATLGVVGSTKTETALRYALKHDHLAPLSAFAVSKFPKTPELVSLRMPKGNPTPEKLAQIARAMGDFAAAHKDAFVAGGFAPDFVEKLSKAAAEMENARLARIREISARVGARKGLDKKLIDGRSCVRVLDKFAKVALKNEPSLLAQWKNVQRVRNVASPAAQPPAAANQPSTGGAS